MHGPLPDPRARAPIQAVQFLFAALVAIDVLLALLHLLAAHTGSYTLSLWFNLDAERAIGPWFSGAQLLVTGLLMLVIGAYSRRPAWPRPAFCHVVGLGFVFLSMDEVAVIHERITGLAKHHDWVPRFAGNRGIWIFAYALLGLALAAAFRADLLAMWRHHRRPAATVALGFTTLATGAVGVEVAGYYGVFRSETWQVAIEEFLEMLGGTIILLGVALFLHRTVRLHPAP
jgi:hypothetical protein